jgi:hypothetical protein
MGGWVSTDFQGRTGTGTGFVREIVNGKLGPICTRAGYLFGANELWKNVTAIGDATSVRHVNSGDYKGQPGQETTFSISSVPMAVKNISIIDTSRRA